MSTANPFVIHHFDRLHSTHQTLWEFVDRDAVSGTTIVAAEQSAGRGQWGRQWNSDRGGLYLSVYWTPGITARRVLQLTLCSAWGIAMALRDRDIPVTLKWPNDLVLAGRKLGGILTETRVRQGVIAQAAIGVGINWENPVPETGINLKSFWQEYQQTPTIATLDELAQIVLQGLSRGWQFCQPESLASLLPAYNTLLVNVGQLVEIESQTGVVMGVAADGRLKIQLNSDLYHNFPEILLEPGKISLGYDISDS